MSNIEKDIKRCEELIKPEHANWIGISNQLAIAHVVERIKELEAKLEFKNWGDLDNTQFEEYMNQFIPKQKVKDKIEENKDTAKRVAGTYQYADSRDDLEEKKRRVIELRIKAEALEELLEDK